MNTKVGMVIAVVVVAVVGVVAAVMLMNKPKVQVNNQMNTGESLTVMPTSVPTGISEANGSTDSADMNTTEGEVKEVVVEGSNFKYVPAELKVKKGQTVRVTFKNTGGTHDFVIDEFEVKTNQIGDEEEEVVEFVADKAGTFEYYCSVGQHRQMGMVGKLIVE